METQVLKCTQNFPENSAGRAGKGSGSMMGMFSSGSDENVQMGAMIAPPREN